EPAATMWRVGDTSGSPPSRPTSVGPAEGVEPRAPDAEVGSMKVLLEFPPDVTEREKQLISFMVNSHYALLCHVLDVPPGGATPEARKRVFDELAAQVSASFP